jgi:hypothetical protein
MNFVFYADAVVGWAVGRIPVAGLTWTKRRTPTKWPSCSPMI